jgi:hypothetical protein
MKEIKAGAITCPNKYYKYKTHADVLKIICQQDITGETPLACSQTRYSLSSYHRGEFNRLKGAKHSQLNTTILLCDVIPDGKTE